MSATPNLDIVYVPTETLNPAVYNLRKWGEEEKKKLTESIKRFGMVDPLIVNNNPERENIVIGGHFRLEIAKELKFSGSAFYSLELSKIEILNLLNCIASLLLGYGE